MKKTDISELEARVSRLEKRASAFPRQRSHDEHDEARISSQAQLYLAKHSKKRIQDIDDNIVQSIKIDPVVDTWVTLSMQVGVHFTGEVTLKTGVTEDFEGNAEIEIEIDRIGDGRAVSKGILNLGSRGYSVSVSPKTYGLKQDEYGNFYSYQKKPNRRKA